MVATYHEHVLWVLAEKREDNRYDWNRVLATVNIITEEHVSTVRREAKYTKDPEKVLQVSVQVADKDDGAVDFDECFDVSKRFNRFIA